MTAFPIGVMSEFTLNRVEKNGNPKWITDFKPTFARATDSNCPQFADIGEMLGIRYRLPEDIPTGRYRINAFFCNRLWEDMPVEIATPEFQVVRP